MKSSFHSLIPSCNYSATASSIQFQAHIPAGWRLELDCTLLDCTAGHIATEGQSVSQSVSKSWCRAPSGAHDQTFITLCQLRSSFSGAPSDERTGLYFAYAAGPRQRSLSQVRVPLDS
jgi:hypothetical protein